MCDACHTVSKWFVCILASMKPAMYHTICLDCYQEDTWQVKVASKEITTSVRLVVEIKYRDKSSFPSPFKVLENRDIAMYKRRTGGKPQTIVIIDGDVFEEKIAPLLRD